MKKTNTTFEPFSEERLGQLMMAVQASTLAEKDKLFYQMTLLQGLFSYELYEHLQRDMQDKLDEHQAQIAQMEEEIAQMEKRQQELDKKVSAEAQGAAKDYQQLREGYAQKKVEEMESTLSSAEEAEVKKLRSQIHHHDQ